MSMLKKYLKSLSSAKNCVWVLQKLSFYLNKNFRDAQLEETKWKGLKLSEINKKFDKGDHALVKFYIDYLNDDQIVQVKNDNLIVKEYIKFILEASNIFSEVFSVNELYSLAAIGLKTKYKLDNKQDTVVLFSFLSQKFNEWTNTNKAFNREKLEDRFLKTGKVSADLFEGFLELLLMEGVVSYAGTRYIRRGKLHPFYLINRLFGLTFNITGFDFLFENGILPSPKVGVAMLVSGGPGDGKTTLSLQLAKETARMGGFAVYFTTEQDIESLKHALGRFGWVDDFRYELKIGTDGLRDLVANRQDGKGILLLSYISKWDFRQTCENIRDIINVVNSASWFRKTIVLDSVNSLEINDSSGIMKIDDNRDKHFIRNSIERLFNVVKKSMFLGIFIGEIGYNDEIIKPCEYLSDVVIKLSVDNSLEYYYRRQIQIAKCRLQHVQRGLHHFMISREAGIQIYPSCSAILDARKGRDRSIINKDSYIKVDAKGFREVLGKDILKNTIAAILGDFGTGKSLLMQNLLMSPSSTEGEYKSETYLIISFLSEINKLQKKLSSVNSNKRLLDQTKKDNVVIEFYTLRPDYVTPGMVYSQILNLLMQYRIKRRPITRVLIDDLIQIEQMHLLLREEDMFLPTLLEIFRTENITTFLSISNYDSVTLNTEFQVRPFCDYIFHTESNSPFMRSSQKNYFAVVESMEKSHSNNLHEMVINEEGITILEKKSIENIEFPEFEIG